MTTGKTKSGWPELWLTPLIGLPCLALEVHHHGFEIAGSGAPVVLAGIVPLLAMAVAQRFLRQSPWPVWGEVTAAAVIGCLAVGLWYFFPLFLGPPPVTDPEGRANIVALYQYDAPLFGGLGGFAAGVSTLAAHWLTRAAAE